MLKTDSSSPSNAWSIAKAAVIGAAATGAVILIDNAKPKILENVKILGEMALSAQTNFVEAATTYPMAIAAGTAATLAIALVARKNGIAPESQEKTLNQKMTEIGKIALIGAGSAVVNTAFAAAIPHITEGMVVVTFATTVMLGMVGLLFSDIQKSIEFRRNLAAAETGDVDALVYISNAVGEISYKFERANGITA